MHAKEHEEKKRKKRNKDSPYFQIKGIHPKRESHDPKEYNFFLKLELYKNSTHLHVLIKVYDLHLLVVRFLT